MCNDKDNKPHAMTALKYFKDQSDPFERITVLEAQVKALEDRVLHMLSMPELANFLPKEGLEKNPVPICEDVDFVDSALKAAIWKRVK